MSRKGNCYDNAPMESFFRSLKVEYAQYEPCSTVEQVTRLTAEYIDRFYNPERLHSALNYVSPIEYEKSQTKPLENCV
jgi:transposase InsO family protein